jgi:hypothetical protein
LEAELETDFLRELNHFLAFCLRHLRRKTEDTCTDQPPFQNKDWSVHISIFSENLLLMSIFQPEAFIPIE